jgi:predicted PurR-regulated permease PerM
MTIKLNWLVLALSLLFFWFVWQLGSLLIPFITAAYLAYLGNPLVHTLMRLRLPRTLAVLVVFSGIILGFVGLWILLLPLLQNEVILFLQQLPALTAWLEGILLPFWQHLAERFPSLHVPSLHGAITQYLPESRALANEVWSTLTASWNTLFTLVLYLLLIPVVTFYLLRDWDELIARQHVWLQLPTASRWVRYAKEVDQVMRVFLRGQLSVIVLLCILYSLGLYLLHIPLALLIGLISGLLSLVPFLGFIIGITLGSVMALIQFHDGVHVFYVLAMFVSISAIENVFLIPRMVGEGLGLHPVAVIFAILAGGSLFGALGVLLALPFAAIIKVTVRHFISDLKALAKHPIPSSHE